MRVIGVDLGIRKIAWAVWEDDVLVETMAYESSRGTRHEQLTDLQVCFIANVAHWEPDHVFIEDTLIGNNRKYSIQLSQTMGAVLSALGTLSGISKMVGKTMGVYTVNNKTWKKEILGNGNAGKHDVQVWLLDKSNAYSVLCGNDQDRFDAACIGFYGLVIADRAVEISG